MAASQKNGNAETICATAVGQLGARFNRTAAVLLGSAILMAGIFAAHTASAETVTFEMKFAPHGAATQATPHHGIARIGNTPVSSSSLMRHYQQTSKACGALGGEQGMACQREADRVLSELAGPQTSLHSDGVQFNSADKSQRPKSPWMKLT